MGVDRTQERRKAKQEERAEKRRKFEEKREQDLAETLARKEAIRAAYRKANPGKHEYTLYFRRNKLVTWDFSNPAVPMGKDPAHPEEGGLEKTAEINAAF